MPRYRSAGRGSVPSFAAVYDEAVWRVYGFFAYRLKETPGVEAQRRDPGGAGPVGLTALARRHAANSFTALGVAVGGVALLSATRRGTSRRHPTVRAMHRMIRLALARAHRTRTSVSTLPGPGVASTQDLRGRVPSRSAWASQSRHYRCSR